MEQTEQTVRALGEIRDRLELLIETRFRAGLTDDEQDEFDRLGKEELRLLRLIADAESSTEQ